MLKVEVLDSPTLKLFQILNEPYEYHKDDITYLQKRLAVTVKQDTYTRVVDAMSKAGVIHRGHRAMLLRLVQQV